MSSVKEAVANAHRQEWAAVLAATVRATRDLDLAEECAQEAYAQALQSWPRTGVPARPGAWLTTVALNRARDLLRRNAVWQRTLPLLVSFPDDAEDRPIDDDRLRLIFTCCHPALAREAQIALTLRLVCGLSTAEVAKAFLVQESTMAARITRAKKKIAAARIPYRVPVSDDLPERIEAVCDVIHLVFTAGHTATSGDSLVRPDLIERAVDLARMLRVLLPGSHMVAGLLALLLLIDARREARLSSEGTLVLLADQDRSRWDQAQIQEGLELLAQALSAPSRYAVQAAIAAVHAEAPHWDDTDWDEIVGLYDVLRNLWPSPVVELNRAVAIGMRDGPEAGLAALAPLLDEPSLSTYPYLAAARADFHSRLGQRPQAATAYEEAILLTDNAVERDFLMARQSWARESGG